MKVYGQRKTFDIWYSSKCLSTCLDNVTPTMLVQDCGAHWQRISAGFNDASNCAARDGLTQSKWGNVAAGVIHPPAHVGVNGHILVEHPHLPWLQGRIFDGCGTEVLVGRPTLRSADELDLSTSGVGHENALPQLSRLVLWVSR